MTLTNPDAWSPVGVVSLETSAEEVVRSKRNSLVVAGPGSGKTELLAQRASYLLETGMCAAPRRILAISFKRDAAENLRERVATRSPERAQRFESYTLDSFAKRLVDRFYPALPDGWRPKTGYEMMLKAPGAREIREWMVARGIPRAKVEGESDSRIRLNFEMLASGFALPYSDPGMDETYRTLGRTWWQEQLDRPASEPALSFPMINRLASFLLRTNPKITRVLRGTYGFVFLDEFQDTTAAQYDLIRSAFRDSQSILTAVGDSKQRIMMWAGAMADVFEKYVSEFAAERYSLVSNYRSAPELVSIQHLIALALERDSPVTESRREVAGSCEIWEFGTAESEAEILAEYIEKGINDDHKNHRDFCILVRQRTAEMIEPLKVAMAARGINLRDESELQDLLVEPVVEFLLALLRLATRTRDPEAWKTLTSEIGPLYGFPQDADTSRIEVEALSLLEQARAEINSGRTIDLLPAELISMIGEARFRSTYMQYRNGSYLTEQIAKLAAKLRETISFVATAADAVNDLIGANVVPAMTIHKSKGLEFETVIFLGLEDSQWWAFSTQAEEEKRGFFVAFSRAISRVVFTFSDVRVGRWGLQGQDKAQIGALYKILLEAGVPTIDYRNEIVAN
ncbi:MAG TPA: ATP-dependent helicase [Pyrinomonadaceae bacterium]|nr:ATP-dependent helicase [Pyrinomonadaceae bacterium]